MTARVGCTLFAVIGLGMLAAIFSVGSEAMTKAQATVWRHRISGHEHASHRLINTDADLLREVRSFPTTFPEGEVAARRLRLRTENGVRVLRIREAAWPHREYRYERTSFDAAPKAPKESGLTPNADRAPR